MILQLSFMNTQHLPHKFWLEIQLIELQMLYWDQQPFRDKLLSNF